MHHHMPQKHVSIIQFHLEPRPVESIDTLQPTHQSPPGQPGDVRFLTFGVSKALKNATGLANKRWKIKPWSMNKKESPVHATSKVYYYPISYDSKNAKGLTTF